jgi:hypothetical protein
MDFRQRTATLLRVSPAPRQLYVTFKRSLMNANTVEVARLLTQIQGLDQRIDSLGIERDRANCTWIQCENTPRSRTKFYSLNSIPISSVATVLCILVFTYSYTHAHV